MYFPNYSFFRANPGVMRWLNTKDIKQINFHNAETTISDCCILSVQYAKLRFPREFSKFSLTSMSLWHVSFLLVNEAQELTEFIWFSSVISTAVMKPKMKFYPSFSSCSFILVRWSSTTRGTRLFSDEETRVKWLALSHTAQHHKNRHQEKKSWSFQLLAGPLGHAPSRQFSLIFCVTYFF